MRIAIGQLDATIGAFASNVESARALARRCREEGASLLVLPELFLSGAPATGLLRFPEFLGRSQGALEELARETVSGDLDIAVGFASRGEDGRPRNAAAFLSEGRMLAVASKEALASTDGGFTPGDGPCLVEHRGVRLGLLLTGGVIRDQATFGALEDLARDGARLLLDLSASPYVAGEAGVREQVLGYASRRLGVPVASCNLVGGNDSTIFGGGSLAVGRDGRVLSRARSFEEDLIVVDIEPGAWSGEKMETWERGGACPSLGPPEGIDMEELASALCLGLRDYVEKTGFRKVILGLSGGIDSAVVAVLATLALGADRVQAVSLPSRYTSTMSVQDAERLSKNLGIQLETLPIEEGMQAYARTLAPVLPEGVSGLTEENLQARIRGDLLMALSNQRSALLLTTGNKSEIGVGYCTLYGDMCGGLAVLGDLPKTWVYALARHLNLRHRAIPPTILSRPPSAELRPDQTDQDSLPPYDALDRVLGGLLRTLGAEGPSQEREDPELVRRVAGLLLGSEFKRAQAAPVLQVTSMPLGGSWRLPIAHAFRP